MKKQTLTIVIAAIAFSIGLGFNNFAISDVPTNYKVAVVDVQAVVEKSSQVIALRKEQQTKMENLQKWIEVAKADVEKQSTQAGKEKLAKKYDNELTKKQEVIKKDYTNKLQTIDKNISSIITNEAKNQNYNLVLVKSTVLYGGDDITSSIIKAVK